MKKKINGCLKEYSVEEVLKAVDNYAVILSNPEQYCFSYKWNLDDFCSRGVKKFVDNAKPFKNFEKKELKKGFTGDGIKTWLGMKKQEKEVIHE